MRRAGVKVAVFALLLAVAAPSAMPCLHNIRWSR